MTLWWLLTLSSSPYIFSQNDAAERLFFNAQTFMTAGKYQEAMTDLDNVVRLHPQSPWASKALLEIGKYHLETAGDDSQAQATFGRILKEYPSGNEAPAAYYYQALIVDKNGNSPQELEAAIADLIRMENLFPQNPWRNGALFLFGKISMRLGQYDQSLSYFQRLEFNYPQSEFLPDALLYSAKVAYYNGFPKEAIRILTRLQAKFPNMAQSRQAASLLRLMVRFETGIAYELDRSFFASTPKGFQNPDAIGIGWGGKIGIKDNRGIVQAFLDGSGISRAPSKDVETFCRDRFGKLLWVFQNRVGGPGGQINFSNLAGSNGPLRSIRGAAVDGYGRLYVLDGTSRDIRAYAANGTGLKNFAISKPKMVRAFEESIWVLNGDSNSFTQIGADFQANTFRLKGVEDIEDFCFDALGHIYVLHDRGNQVSVFDRDVKPKFNKSLKAGTWPLKKATAIAADASGALYLSDKKSGAVYRFQ